MILNERVYLCVCVFVCMWEIVRVQEREDIETIYCIVGHRNCSEPFNIRLYTTTSYVLWTPSLTIQSQVVDVDVGDGDDGVIVLPLDIYGYKHHWHRCNTTCWTFCFCIHITTLISSKPGWLIYRFRLLQGQMTLKMRYPCITYPTILLSYTFMYWTLSFRFCGMRENLFLWLTTLEFISLTVAFTVVCHYYTIIGSNQMYFPSSSDNCYQCLTFKMVYVHGLVYVCLCFWTIWFSASNDEIAVQWMYGPMA